MESNVFFQTEKEATLRSIRPFQIHGARFVEISFSLDGDPNDSWRKVKVSDNLIYAAPKSGDRVRIGILMGNVTHVVKVD